MRDLFLDRNWDMYGGRYDDMSFYFVGVMGLMRDRSSYNLWYFYAKKYWGCRSMAVSP